MTLLQKINSLPEFENLEIEKYTSSFVPYLYLDGHRSSNSGSSDLEKYSSGFRFFLRFGTMMQQLGFTKMVTMVHTSRNCKDRERIDSIQSAVQKSIDFTDDYVSKSKFQLYGDIESYKSMGNSEFYNYLNEVDNKSPAKPDFIHHILINYSEQWAINNLDRINLMPDISCVIRFTKGFVSGGWIPIKMQKTTFVYSQVPSVSEFWSDDGILALFLISLKNWIATKDFIGTKSYDNEEKELIHKKRDIDLSHNTIKLYLNSPLRNRIISFEVEGPVIYEL